jgi:2'-5' RNA ligase
MHGIVSVLNPPAYAQVEAIWQALEDKCGLSGIKMTPLAHFSWQVVEKYELEQTRGVIEHLSQASRPFPASASGLGIFAGKAPVVYIPLVKDENLLRFHARLWEATGALVDGASQYYSPRLWMPHITLAYGDVDVNKLACAMQALAFAPLELEILVDNLALVYQADGEEGYLEYRYDFQR